MTRGLAAALVALCAAGALAAPDEDKLGKAAGCPVGTAATWFFDESMRVGSFTHQAEIPGICRGKVDVLAPAATPMPLPKPEREPDCRWSDGDAHDLTVDDLLARQRVRGSPRRFAMLGLYGQSILIDPALRLVVVMTAANATAQARDTTLARERDAFWRGVMRYYATSVR